MGLMCFRFTIPGKLGAQTASRIHDLTITTISTCLNLEDGWTVQDFWKWIKWWHDEAHSHCPGSKLLIMDNCEGHSISVDLHDVRIVILPPRSTAKHQPLDLSIIGNCKIRYRALLLRSIIKIVEARSEKGISLRADSKRGMYGIRDGHLSHIGDGTDIFNEAWRLTKRATIIKGWIKSWCLDEAQSVMSQNKLDELNNANEAFINLTDQIEGIGTTVEEQVVNASTCQRVMKEISEIASIFNRFSYCNITRIASGCAKRCGNFGIYSCAKFFSTIR